MVRTTKDQIDLEHVDFSFIPSLRCNLSCSFCMYCAGPDVQMVLDLGATRRFMKTVEWDRVAGWGLYGGEPSIDLSLYQRFYDLLPKHIKKFIITNGSWSKDKEKITEFLSWCAERVYVVVSGTPSHVAHQNRSFLEELSKDSLGVIIKADDELHPMGRLAKDDWTCTKKCLTHPQPIRVGLFPSGDFILQNCDGVYPVLGDLKYSFRNIFNRARSIREQGCVKGCYNVNDILRKGGLLS